MTETYRPADESGVADASLRRASLPPQSKALPRDADPLMPITIHALNQVPSMPNKEAR